jgi:hypothetical protein
MSILSQKRNKWESWRGSKITLKKKTKISSGIRQKFILISVSNFKGRATSEVSNIGN